MGNALQRARFLQPGDKLGKHDLIRQIAVGGMAELYLARTVGIEGFEKLAVVKRILPQYAANASFVHMFLNEARLAATFQHPNIAQVYDIGQEQGEFFFSMEYVHGEDLGRLVATSIEQGIPISLDAALTLAAGLCAGLHHAHEKVSPEGKALNVVHRDVSPSNVLVSYDGAVKLVDFGIARVNTTPTTSAGGLKGKISYMSPEQCRGKATLDRRSDIFSVGTIIYELTTGQLPFTDETEYGVLNQIVNHDADPPSKLVPGYPPGLEAIVMRSLARDPDQRYASARELQGALEDFALENRLRVSALVLARIMSTLFPQRLEEWDHARKQGAFFVEQHVVRTLIESGKTGEEQIVSDDPSAPHETPLLPAIAGETAQLDDDSTAVTAPPVAPDDDATAVRAPPIPLPGVHERPMRASRPGFPSPHPYPEPPRPYEPPPTTPGVTATAVNTAPVAMPAPMARATTPYPMPGQPGAVPIYVPLPAPQPGTLVSNPNVPSAAAMKVGDVTERVRAPTAVELVRRSKKGALVLVFALAGAAAAALVTFLVLNSTSDPPQLAKTPPAASGTPEGSAQSIDEPEKIVMDPEPKVEPAAKAVKAEPKPEPKREPKVEKTVPKPEPKPEPIAVKKAPVPPPPTVAAKPKPKPKTPEPKPKTDVKKPEPKEQQWTDDSPFMPVRPDKK